MKGRLLHLLGALALVGLATVGCSDSDVGSVVQPGGVTNFVVTNKHGDRIHIYVDGDSVGDVAANGVEQFSIKPGFRALRIRESGSSEREYQGQFNFTNTATIDFTYDPSVTVNLSVTNNSPDKIDVFVDYTDIGAVNPGATRTWLIESGRWDMHLRETGTVTLDYVGTFNFNTSAVVDVTAN